MRAQLEALEADLQVARTRTRRLLDSTSDAQWSTRAEPARWSVAECIAHLNLTAAAMVPRMRAAWGEAKALGGGAPEQFRPPLSGRLLAALLGPLPTWARFLAFRTPDSFVPAGDLARATVEQEHEEWLAVYRGLIQEADALPIDRVTMDSPFRAGTRYDGYTALRIVIRHEHRHLVQAERVWPSR